MLDRNRRPLRRVALMLAALLAGLCFAAHAEAADPTVTLPPSLRGKWSGTFDGLGQVDLFLEPIDPEGKKGTPATTPSSGEAVIADGTGKHLAWLTGELLATGPIKLRVLLFRDVFVRPKPIPDAAWTGALKDKRDPSFPDYLGTELTLTYDASTETLSGPYTPLDLHFKDSGEYESTETLAAKDVKLTRVSYVKDCLDKQVPTPPDWNKGGWTKVGDLPPNLNFDGPDKPDTSIYTHEAPDGICFALPRRNAAGDIDLLGIICQGKTSGNACFWDNVKRDGSVRIKGGATDGMKATDIQGGDQLAENCTRCHRGQNAFVVTRGTPLDLAPSDLHAPRKDDPAKGSYKPVGQFTWSNPRWTGPAIEQCSECHTLPAPSKGFCGVMNSMLDLGIMPPQADASYDADVAKLKAACGSAPAE